MSKAIAKDARLTAFDHHSDDLLDILENACERRPQVKSLDRRGAWRKLKFMAGVYLQEEAAAEAQRNAVSASDRAELLDDLGTSLGAARCKLAEAIKRSELFLAWCEASGTPDWTHPIMGIVENKFEEMVAGVAALERAAHRAAEQVRQGPGRPPGTGLLRHDFIVRLESTYREITGKKGGAGNGPFSQFVEKFLIALGRHCAPITIIDAIKAAKKREEKHPMTSRWGRSYTGF